MTRISLLPVLPPDEIDGSEQVPLVKDGQTHRANLDDIPAPEATRQAELATAAAASVSGLADDIAASKIVTDQLNVTTNDGARVVDQYGRLIKSVTADRETVAGATIADTDGAFAFRVTDQYGRLFGQINNDGQYVAGATETALIGSSASRVWAGALTETGFTVAADIEGEDRGEAVLVVSSDPAFANREFISAPVLPYATAKNDTQNFRSVKIAASGLRPDTSYSYRVDVDGVEGEVHTVRTAPASGDFTFIFGSCSNDFPTTDWLAMSAIKDAAPLFLLHIGDLWYSDIDTDDIRLQRQSNSRAARDGITRFADLLASVPVIYQSDNHDTCAPNQHGDIYPGTTFAQVVENSKKAFRETVPHYAFATDDSGEIGQAFSFDVAGVRFVVLDTVTFSSASTVIGARQMAWLKGRLSDSAGISQIFIASPENWIDVAQGWEIRSPVEQAEICDYIRDAAGLPPCTLLTGDVHFCAVDDGTNTDKSTGGGMPFFPQIVSSGLSSNTGADASYDTKFEWNGAVSHFHPGTSGTLSQQFVEVTVRAAGGWIARVYGGPYAGAVPTLLATYDTADI